MLDFDFGYRGLVAAFSYQTDECGHSRNFRVTFGVTFWRMNSPRDITFLHHCLLPDFGGRSHIIYMDDHYVAVIMTMEKRYWDLLYLVSTKTLSLENCLMYEENKALPGRYQKGHLIFLANWKMR